jgi:hypothetical protein
MLEIHSPPMHGRGGAEGVGVVCRLGQHHGFKLTHYRRLSSRCVPLMVGICSPVHSTGPLVPTARGEAVEGLLSEPQFRPKQRVQGVPPRGISLIAKTNPASLL